MPKKKNTKRTRSRSSKTAPSSPPPQRPRSRASSTTVQLPRLMTVDEVADLLRTTRKAIYCQIHRGELPGVIRLSRRVLVDGSALVEWLDQKRAVSLTDKRNQR